MKRLLVLALALFVLACQSDPEPEARIGPREDQEQIPDRPLRDLETRFYDADDIVGRKSDYPAPRLGLRVAGLRGERKRREARYRGVTAAHSHKSGYRLEIYDVQDLLSAVPDFPGDRIRVGGDVELSAGGTGKVVASKRTPVRPVIQRSELLPNVSRLAIGEREALPLRGFQASVRIDGFRARVVLDLLYENERDQIHEGAFQLRLPNGASPCFLAFGQAAAISGDATWATARVAAEDFQPERILSNRSGALSGVKVARLVPRRRAERAYRATVRRRVDPALAQWEGAGVFRARVFPLGPKQHHRIVVAYDCDLERTPSGLRYALTVPEVPRATVDLSLPSGAKVWPAAGPARELAGESSRAAYRYQDAQGSLEVTLPGPEPLLVGRHPKTKASYFATRFVPELPPTSEVGGAERGVFLLDLSRSGAADVAARLDLLERILKENRDQLRRFAVVCFDTHVSVWREGFHANTAENLEAFLARARSLRLEGASDVGAGLRAAAQLAGGSPADLFLLSDGEATWGERDLSVLEADFASAERRLFAYRVGAGAAPRGVASLALASGGAVFGVGAEDLSLAARAHRQPPWRLRRVEVPGGTGALIAGRPSALFPGQALRLVGQGAPQAGLISLELWRGDEALTVSTQLRVVSSPLAARAYGEVATSELEDRGGLELRELATAFARHFRVPRKSCSLLMLESEADYRAQGIADVATSDAALVAKADVLSRLEERSAPRTARTAFLERFQALSARESSLAPIQSALLTLPASRFVLAPERDPNRLAEGAAPEPASALEPKALIARALRLSRAGRVPDAVRAFSSLLESSPESPLVIEAGYRALVWREGRAAYHLFARAGRSPHQEALGWTGMARALEVAGRLDLALICYEAALAADRQARPELTRREYLGFLLRHLRRSAFTLGALAERRRAELKSAGDGPEAAWLARIEWNTDTTDVDLYVGEPASPDAPKGRVCSYENRKTPLGVLSEDVTDGYGPEEYARLSPAVELASAGCAAPFALWVKYYSGDQLRTSTRTVVLATVWRDPGEAHEEVTRQVVVLEQEKGEASLGKLYPPSKR